MARPSPLVLKLGGELLEDPARIRGVVDAIVRLAAAGPLVVVHGGGREIDAELALRGIPKRAVDGLRITDEATLDVVVAVLAGRVNTRLVAACSAAGARAVGLTGADAFLGLVEPAPPYRTADGGLVDLERVGQPVDTGPPALVADLCRLGYVPIIACIGSTSDGRLFNVNADALAAHLAGALGARELVIAGGTPGVVDAAGRPIARLDAETIETLVARGDATAGMIAKLMAACDALRRGVRRVRIVDGRDMSRPEALAGTEIVADAARAALGATW